MKVPEKEILEGNIWKVLFALGWPMMVSSLLQTAYNIADTFWLGRWKHASEAVASMQISWPMIFVLISLAFGFGVAGVSLVAQYTGAGKEDKASFAAGQVLGLGVLIGIFISTIGIIIAPYLVAFMGVEPTVGNYATSYMRIIFAGLPFTFISMIFMFILRAYGDPITPMIVNGLSVAANIILDPFFINGWWIFPEMGVAGAAVATVISRGAASIVAIYILFRGVENLKIKRDYIRPRVEHVKKILKIGLPASMGQFSSALGFFFLMFIISSLPNSTIALAAYGVGDRIINVSFIVINGLSSAMATVIGHSLGADRFDRAEETFKKSVQLIFLLLAMETAIIFFFREPLARFFIPTDEDVIAEASLFLGIFTLGIPFFGIFSAVQGVYRGAGYTVPNMIMSLLRLWLFRVAFAYILGIAMGLGSYGIWWGMAISNIASAMVALAFFATGSWRRKVID